MESSQVPGKQILYAQFCNPGIFPPLLQSSKILAERGWAVRMLGTWGRGGATNRLTVPAHPGITVEMRGGGGGNLKLEFAKYFLWVLREMGMRRPQVVYCSDYLTAPIAMVATRVFGIATVYHEHDAPADRPGKVHEWCMAARKWVVANAWLVVTPSEARAEMLRRLAGRGRIRCVANCPGLGEAERLGRRERGGGDLRLWYHGALNAELLPEVVLEAMALAGEGIRLDFAGYESVFTPGYIEGYMRRAEALGLGGRVAYTGVHPRDELLARATGADVGLALFQPSFPQPLAGASNKVFDYLLAGLPVLLPETAEWREYRDAGVAIGCPATDAHGLAERLAALRDGRESLGPMRERGRAMILGRWNYEAQFAPVAEMLEGVGG